LVSKKVRKYYIWFWRSQKVSQKLSEHLWTKNKEQSTKTTIIIIT